MSGRSVRVGALSDKIQGLKFMQRAPAAGSSSSPSGGKPFSSSTSSAPPASVGKDASGGTAAGATTGQIAAGTSKQQARQTSYGAVDDDDDDDTGRTGDPLLDDGSQLEEAQAESDGNEEHWVLPGAASRALPRQRASVQTIDVEPGWHAWLGQLEAGDRQRHSAHKHNNRSDDDAAAADAADTPTMTARRSFGGWGTSGKRKARKESAARDEDDSGKRPHRKQGERDNSPGSGTVSSDEASSTATGKGPRVDGKQAKAGHSASKPKPKGFIKPGARPAGEEIVTNIRKAPTAKGKQDAAPAPAPTPSASLGRVSAAALKKQKKQEKREASDTSHSAARQEAAKRKREDMASAGKAAKRKEAEFAVPDPQHDADDGFDFDSDNDEGGYAELDGF